MNFWVAHARGCDFSHLKDLGFTLLYPKMDDYVFLEVSEDNRKFLKKQAELSISFLKDKSGYNTITQAELDAMYQASESKFSKGDKVYAVSGFASGLRGEIVKVLESSCEVILQGYRRKYEVQVDKIDLVKELHEEIPGN